jgi:peptidoglycan hydrolase-like protein with peptidoglycan-binding domain
VRARGVLGVALAAGVAVWPGPAAASPQQAGVQVALRALGLYKGSIDGEVGPETVAAVRAAQAHVGLPVTGRIDTATRDALGPLGRPLFGKRALVPGDFGLDVSVLQFLLVRRGLYGGPLDGFYGRRTEAAVERFQHRRKLAVDGVAGPSTLSALAGAAPHRAPRRVYVVQPGDSLTAIAGRFDISVARLARMNGLDAGRVLPIGTRLAVPAAAGGTAPAADPGTVQAALGDWAERLGVSPHLVRALAWMESGFQPDVVSPVGARGVLQVMPTTRAFVEQVLVGHPIPQTLDGDIEVGVLYLRHLLGQFDGDTELALGAWYQGEAAVRRYGLYAVTKPFVADVLALQSRM